MTPSELTRYLSDMVKGKLQLSVMIWGAPGIGKSSIVSQVAVRHKLELVDVRLSQLAPTDLRGLPVPENGISRWFPPEFLPREGQGILFLDEFNMSPPAVQGISQQLILDRKVGMYVVPPGWFIWAAGNRKEDRAAVFEMPAPLTNRFIHLDVTPDFDSFREYAISKNVHEQILAFLSFRSSLLHNFDADSPAWPSPRTWEMASLLHRRELDIAPAVGRPCAAEFGSFLGIYKKLIDLDAILNDKGRKLRFPREPSASYAVTVGLALRAETVKQALSAFHWMIRVASTEWVQLFVSNLVSQMRSKNRVGMLALCIQGDKKLQKFIQDYHELKKS